MRYDHATLEKKWQERWRAEAPFAAPDRPTGKKAYVLDMFPYPSGQGLHVGHPKGYTATDVVARKRRAEGWSVLHPMGWDAFGLPTENYAIKVQKNPKEIAAANIDNFRRQIQSLGFSYDWTREVNTSDPSYYKWTQWLFLKLYERGLAYKAKAPVNWCPKDQTVLANEQVVNGCCERCGTPVEQKELSQWFFRITAYADRLLAGLEGIEWPERIKAMQRNWIGKSTGAEIAFAGVTESGEEFSVPVFTTRPDTLYGVVAVVLAPEHPLVATVTAPAFRDRVEAFVTEAAAKAERERTESVQKRGTALGVSVRHPLTGANIPLWIADYVLPQYGTGAVMVVPAHDDRDWAFAEAYGFDPLFVIAPPAGIQHGEGAYTGEGIMVNSGPYDGIVNAQAATDIVDALVAVKAGTRAVHWHLRDWLVSRQRYWGAPIPIILCDDCGEVPVPEKDLPVELPDDVDFRPTGESPLARSASFHDVSCPRCGNPARRESDTMDTFVDSSWYFLRYCSPTEDDRPFDPALVAAWCPVDLYVGGAEHAVLHLLYARFVTKVLFDVGALPFDEPARTLRNVGLILGEDGEKMSKSRGNVVNPDDVVAAHGADTFRIYEMFMGPFEDAAPWNEQGIVGVRRFLERAHGLAENVGQASDAALHRLTHQTLAKVSADIEGFRFNTAVSALMILVNAFGKAESVPQQDWETFLQMLSPFAPHLAEELWERLGYDESVARQNWPTADAALLVEDEMKIVVQVDGKMRDALIVPAGIDEESLKGRVLASEKVQTWIRGRHIEKIVVVPGKLVSIVLQKAA
ncbi:leucine--tRNA ligase [Patescibacteria group bacterium]|nr:MAG: leucine--tRNA ligase [Patescibacteria group bacterium]